MESLYADTPYHNKIHAADVTQTCYAFLATGGLGPFLSDVQTLAMLLAGMYISYIFMYVCASSIANIYYGCSDSA
jgi:hypothetical protein